MNTAQQTELLKAAKWAAARATLRGNGALAAEADAAFAALKLGASLDPARRAALTRLGRRA